MKRGNVFRKNESVLFLTPQHILKALHNKKNTSFEIITHFFGIFRSSVI